MLAALGHLGVLLMLSHGRHFRKQMPADGSMEVVPIEMPKPAEVSAKPPDPQTKYRARARQPRLERPALSIPPALSQAPQTDDHPGNAITDWDAQAHDAAAGTLRRAREAAQRRSFGHELATPATPEKPGVFGSEQENHRSGRVEGGTRFWVTDNCYYDIPRGSPPPRTAGEFHLLTPTCKAPPTGGGDQLFKDLAPESLHELPAPQAAR